MTPAFSARCRRLAPLFALAASLSLLLSACALDDTGAVTTSHSGSLPSDTAAPTSPGGTPMMSNGTGSSMGSNGLGGGRGSF